MTKQYPLYEVRGGARDLGRQHGEQAATHIAAHLDFLGSTLQLNRVDLCSRAARFRPLLQKQCPHLLAEIEGLAEGAGISPEEALAVNVRAALGLPELAEGAADAGCTAFALAPAVTAQGALLIGQTSDTVPLVEELAYVLRVLPDDGRPAALMWTFGGMIGYHGLNAHGVAHFANDLGGGPARRFALPHYPLKRLLLECRGLDEALALFEALPLASSGNYVLCDGTGRIADVEATPEGCEVLGRDGPGWLVHANHFVGHRASPENHARSAPDSFFRQQRLEALVQTRLGQATPADLQAFLHDRENHPTAICRDARTAEGMDWEFAGITVAALVAEPTRGLLHIARGNDPATPYATYALQG